MILNHPIYSDIQNYLIITITTKLIPLCIVRNSLKLIQESLFIQEKVNHSLLVAD